MKSMSSKAFAPHKSCTFFFFNDTAPTEIYTLSLHDALPISARADADPRDPHTQRLRPLPALPATGAARGDAGRGSEIARLVARRGRSGRDGGAGGARQLSAGRQDGHGSPRGGGPLRRRAIHGVVRGAVSRRPAAARRGDEDRQSPEGQLFRRPDRRPGDPLDARAGARRAHRGARSGASLERGHDRRPRAAGRARRRRALPRRMAVCPGQCRGAAGPHGPQRDRPAVARGGAGTARARLSRRGERVGHHPSHLAGSGRARGSGIDGHDVRGAPPPLATSMSRSLQEVIDALARAGVLIDAPKSAAGGGALPEITGLTADARRLTPGMLFCAVRGAVLDGHAFVGDAAARGAAAALVESRQSVAIPQILVRNGRRAAAIAAEAWYRRPAARLQLIGVTGTNGKTTSVILSQHVLSPLWPMGAIGTLGAFDPSGAPVDRGAGGVAMEVSSHSLDQGRVEGLIFRAAIFTNLTRDHLDYHETFDAYFAAKARLVGYLADAGLAVINADDVAWARLPRTPRRITFSATLPRADVTARDVRIDAKGAHFTLVTTGGSHPVSLPLLGRFNVANALGVAACAVGLDVPARVVAERLSTAPQVPGRMERIAVDPCVVLRDYAHTPDALERALETVREVTPPAGRVIVVFGAGGDRDRGKRAPMGEIAVRLADVAIATSDNPRTEDPERILDDVEAGMSGRQHYRVVDRRAAIGQALELARQGDTVLLAGKGHETYQVVGTVKEPFDEREVVRSLGAN